MSIANRTEYVKSNFSVDPTLAGTAMRIKATGARDRFKPMTDF